MARNAWVQLTKGNVICIFPFADGASYSSQEGRLRFSPAVFNDKKFELLPRVLRSYREQSDEFHPGGDPEFVEYPSQLIDNGVL